MYHRIDKPFVELRDYNGSWSRYTGTEIVTGTNMSDQTPDLPTAVSLTTVAPHALQDVVLTDSVNNILGQSSFENLKQPVDLSTQPENSLAMGSLAFTEPLQLFPDLNPEFLGDEWKLYWPMPESQNADDIVESLKSVHSDTLLGKGTDSEHRLDETNTSLYVGLQTLLYSAVNMFAGLQTVFLGSFFNMVWQEPKLQSQMSHILKAI